MKTIDIREAIGPLAEYAKTAQTEPVVVTENGTPTAVVLPLENSDLESVSLSTNLKFLALIERSRTRARNQGGISADEMRRRLASD